MALSESGLMAQGITPGPMMVKGVGTVRPKKGSATTAVRKGGKQSFYVKSKGRRK